MVGCGYEGLTKELDDTVKREAELLTTTFNRDVEIRFNSDRESGGAWLKNSLKSFASNCQVGLGAGLKHRFPDGIKREDIWLKPELLYNQPKELYIDTYVDQSALRDASLANSGNPDCRYCSLDHKTVDKALTWLIANVDTEKIYK
jgi:hypothetical protein